MEITKKLEERSRNERIIDLLNEVGMLRHTPRTGYQFLGTGKENVAEHSYRTAVIGYVLATLAGADKARVTFLCLFHDLHEARTGDFNYVNHIYNSTRARTALEHATAGTGLEEDILPLWDEMTQADSLEARLAHDADQLDLLLNLKAESDKGNAFADDWIDSAIQRLKSPEAQELAAVLRHINHNEWWYVGTETSWWASRHGE